MEDNMLKLWMPIAKSADGNFVGILSDTSLDRDEEFMTKGCIESWAKNKSLPALANHENKMEKWIGGWKNIKSISKGSHTALVATPFFFSKEANPLAEQIKKQIEEAVDNGLNPGISIGAIPKSYIEKEINGKMCKGYDVAELVEATWVPIQSNRNASFGHVAKSFDINEVQEKMVDIKKDAAEELAENVVAEEVKEEPAVVEPVKEEVEEKPVEESPAEEVKEEVEPKEDSEELKQIKAELVKANEKIKELESKAVMKAVKETNVEVDDSPFSLKAALKAKYM